ncbi:MAG: hypothetical protein ACFFDW_14250, partial [Candidatus Thorarchaeota archaeon]
KVELFPEESLWFLEETISKKKQSILRKSLIDVSAILSKECEITLNDKWLKDFRKNVSDKKYKKLKNLKMDLVKIPGNALTHGFIFSNSRLITFTSQLKEFVNSSNIKEDLLLHGFKPLQQFRFLRQKIQIEIIIESLQYGKTRIWAIGIKEGTYINKIKQYEKSLSLFIWLKILHSLIVHPDKIENLVVYTLDFNLDLAATKEFPPPINLLEGCPT